MATWKSVGRPSSSATESYMQRAKGTVAVPRSDERVALLGPAARLCSCKSALCLTSSTVTRVLIHSALVLSAMPPAPPQPTDTQ